MSEKKAFIFPGQASQFVGMAKDLFEEFAVAREMFAKANEILGFDIQKICFEGPDEELTKTSVTQPAILIHCAIVVQLLKDRGLTPAMAAGHSLGEYSALFAAEVLSFEDALRLVKLRGELMHRAGVERPGTMAAVIGLKPDEIDSVCDEVTASESDESFVVQAANFNSREQTVISGAIPAVERAMAAAKERGAKIVKKLNVGCAFHSPLMAAAREGLQEGLSSVTFHDAKFPVYVNVTGQPEQNSARLREYLDQQLTSSVRWLSTIENMISDGAQEFLEVGPGKVLSGLLKRINRKLSSKTVGTVTELQAL